MLNHLRQSGFVAAGLALVVCAATIRLIGTAEATNHSPLPSAQAAEASLAPPTAFENGAILAASSVLPSASTPSSVAALIATAKRDPDELARMGFERYKQEIRDYTCTFVKQERIKGKLGDVERIAVRFRDEPFSLYMNWLENADQVRRVLYIDRPDFVDDEGRKIAKVEPAGSIIRLLVSEVDIPIHGKRATETSRRPLDRFGFREVFELLEQYNTLGKENGVLEFTYEGESQIGGRPTFVLVRYLPYTGPDGTYPDAKMALHLDQEWLLPTALYSYGDREGKELLGAYIYENVKLNQGLTDEDFKF